MWEKLVNCIKGSAAGGGPPKKGCQGVNLSDLMKQVPPNQQKQFKMFAKKHDEYKARVRKYPESMPAIDWEYYRKNVRTEFVEWVNQYETKYDKMSSIFDNRHAIVDHKRHFELVDKQSEEVQKEICAYKEASDDRIKQLTEKLEFLKNLKPYEQMTMEELCFGRPHLAPDYINKPTFWPHTPEEQLPGPTDPAAAAALHEEPELPEPPKKPPPPAPEKAAAEAAPKKPSDTQKNAEAAASEFAEKAKAMAKDLVAKATVLFNTLKEKMSTMAKDVQKKAEAAKKARAEAKEKSSTSTTSPSQETRDRISQRDSGTNVCHQTIIRTKADEAENPEIKAIHTDLSVEAEVDPCKADPCKADPCKADPCKADPCKADPCDVDPCKADPCKEADPCDVDPCKADPCKADPCKIDSSKVDPCKEDPCKEDPCKEDPCKEDPWKQIQEAEENRIREKTRDLERRRQKEEAELYDSCEPKKEESVCEAESDPCKPQEEESVCDPCEHKEEPDPCKDNDPCKRKEEPDPCKDNDPCKNKGTEGEGQDSKEPEQVYISISECSKEVQKKNEEKSGDKPKECASLAQTIAGMDQKPIMGKQVTESDDPKKNEKTTLGGADEVGPVYTDPKQIAQLLANEKEAKKFKEMEAALAEEAARIEEAQKSIDNKPVTIYPRREISAKPKDPEEAKKSPENMAIKSPEDIAKEVYSAATDASALLSEATNTLDDLKRKKEERLEVMEQAYTSAQRQAAAALAEASKAVNTASELAQKVRQASGEVSAQDQEALAMAEKHALLAKMMANRAVALKDDIARALKNLKKED